MEVIPVCFKSHTLWYVNYLLQFYSLSSHFDIHDQAEKKQNNVVYKAINLNTELIQTILLKIFLKRYQNAVNNRQRNETQIN